ncbi:MAG: hypothetical protein HDQ88_02525 [Clostridia bacterium]|nr:hypothetical protein [Clostridia bacterium]
MKRYYQVFRMYSEDELYEYDFLEDKPKYIGWTDDEEILDAFFSQRDRHKYRMKKSDMDEEIESKDYLLDDRWKLHIEMFHSNHTDEMVPIITTDLEILSAVDKLMNLLDSYMTDSLSNVIYYSLEDQYRGALRILGYQPKDKTVCHLDDILCPEGMEALNLFNRMNSESNPFIDNLLSLESFIKVMEFHM